MSSPARENRVTRRMMGPNGRAIMSQRFNRAMDKIDRRNKSDAAHVLWIDTDWHYTGGRGLIHNGRKP